MIYILIAIVVLAGLTAGGWYIKERRRSPTNSSVSTPPTVIVTKPDFSELGISVSLPESLKNLKYVPQVSPDKTSAILMLQLDSYDSEVAKCLGTPGKGGPALATLQKIKGTYDPAKIPKTTNLKQFDGFYIGANLPTALTCKDKTNQAAYDQLADQLTKSIETTFANAVIK